MFAKPKSIFKERKTFFLKIITCDPSIYPMDHPDLTISNFIGNSIGTKKGLMCVSTYHIISREKFLQEIGLLMLGSLNDKLIILRYVEYTTSRSRVR